MPDVLRFLKGTASRRPAAGPDGLPLESLCASGRFAFASRHPGVIQRCGPLGHPDANAAADLSRVKREVGEGERCRSVNAHARRQPNQIPTPPQIFASPDSPFSGTLRPAGNASSLLQNGRAGRFGHDARSRGGFMRTLRVGSRRARVVALLLALALGAGTGYAALALANHEHAANLWWHGQGTGDLRNGKIHPYLGSTDGTARQGYVTVAKGSGYHYKEVSDIATHIHMTLNHSIDQCIFYAHVRSPQTSLPHHDGHGCH